MKFKRYTLSLILAVMAAGAPLCMIASEAPGTETVAQDTPQVKVRPGGLTIDIPGDSQRHATIYALTGQVVKQATLTPGQNVIDLPAGYYIVRIGHFSVKVVVK